jgi:hypothetical protein
LERARIAVLGTIRGYFSLQVTDAAMISFSRSTILMLGSPTFFSMLGLRASHGVETANSGRETG